MKWKNTVATMFVISSLSTALSAQEVEDKFKGIDNLLESLSALSTTSATAPLPDTEGNVDTAQQDMVADDSIQPPSEVTEEKPPADDLILLTPVLDTPPYTRFEFNSDVVIPAYRSGVLFENGELKYNVGEDVKLETVLAERDVDSCIILSNKNYLIMRGKGSSRPTPSFIDVKSVELLEVHPKGNESQLIYKIQFHPKTPKGSDELREKEVRIALLCMFPSHKKSSDSKATLGEINRVVGGLFSIELPQFIEI